MPSMRIRIFRTLFFSVTLAIATNSFASSPITPQEALVARLYRDYSFEAVIDEPMFDGSDIFSQSRGTLLKYFEGKLADLIIRNGQCEEKTHELCSFDFSPLWDSQDPVGAIVKIKPGEAKNSVAVEVKYPSEQEPRRLVYFLIQIGKVWRIKDVSYGPDRKSMIQILEENP